MRTDRAPGNAACDVWVLHIKSWDGVTPGAMHYYGRIENQESMESVEIERVLDASEARALTRMERESARYQLSEMSRDRAASAFYVSGDTTERFTSREALTIAAIHTFGEVAKPPASLFTHMGWLKGDDPITTLGAPEDA